MRRKLGFHLKGSRRQGNGLVIPGSPLVRTTNQAIVAFSAVTHLVMADAPHVAPLISFLLTLFLVNVLLKSSRDDIIYQRPSFANGLIVLAATFPRISHRKFVKSGKSMLRRRYSTRKYLFILFLLISNDIQLNPGLNSSTLKSCSLNARSIVNKRTELQAVVATKELDIIAITETWLNPEIMDQEILSSDYNIYR